MQCPYCRSDNDRVTDTRASDDGLSIRRRRECLSCKRRYNTIERLERIAVKVVKKDGSREPFRREKIRLGLEKACWKRPISDLQIDAVVSAVESEIYDGFDGEVESQQLGEMVMDHLATLDEVAYVRFASVYRRFKNIHDFMDQLQPMLDEKQQSDDQPALLSDAEPGGD